MRGTEVDSEQTIGDYKDIDGLITAHSFENGVKGQPEKQKLTLENVELNVPIDDSRFAMPPASGAPAENPLEAAPVSEEPGPAKPA